MATRIEPPTPRSGPPPLTPEQCRQLRFVLALVGLIAARHGFDPASLVSPRTGTPLGPALSRMREALEASESEPDLES